MNKSKNLVGQKFGKLTVISKAKSILGGDTIKRYWGAWNCQCNCGNTKIVKTVHLNKGQVTSCGCLYDEFGKTFKPGQKINRLTTISYKDGKWLCLCECGNHIEVETGKITNGNTKSCGCLKTDTSSKNAYKLIEGRRLNEPRIASARRVWQSYCNRDRECTITIEEFLSLSQQICFYCGIEPNTKYNYFATISSNSSDKAKSEGLFVYNGLDRINSSLPHTLDNIVPCCYDCNRSKSDYSTEEFLEWIGKLTITEFHPIIIPFSPPLQKSPLTTSIKCVFYNHKNDTDMTVEEYYSISQMNCFYCGSLPSNLFNYAKKSKKASLKAKEQADYIYNGIDRVDRSQPHNKDNIVPCCYHCNFAKSKLALPEFQSWIKRVQKFQQHK